MNMKRAIGEARRAPTRGSIFNFVRSDANHAFARFFVPVSPRPRVEEVYAHAARMSSSPLRRTLDPLVSRGDTVKTQPRLALTFRLLPRLRSVRVKMEQ